MSSRTAALIAGLSFLFCCVSARADALVTFAIDGSGQLEVSPGAPGCRSELNPCHLTLGIEGAYTLDLQTHSIVGPWSFHQSDYGDWGVSGIGPGNSACTQEYYVVSHDCTGIAFINPALIYFSQPRDPDLADILGTLSLDAVNGVPLVIGSGSAYEAASLLDGLGYPFGSDTTLGFTYTATAVPEPPDWLLLVSGLGLAGLLLAARRREEILGDPEQPVG